MPNFIKLTLNVHDLPQDVENIFDEQLSQFEKYFSKRKFA